MTSTFELDLDTSTVKMNQRAKYVGQKSFIWKVIFRTHTHTHTHTPDRLLHLDY